MYQSAFVLLDLIPVSFSAEAFNHSLTSFAPGVEGIMRKNLSIFLMIFSLLSTGSERVRAIDPWLLCKRIKLVKTKDIHARFGNH